jgi:hypothetical protein
MQSSEPAKRGPRWPIIMTAMAQFAAALLIIAVTAEYVIPPAGISDWVVLCSIPLLIGSGITLVIPQPWSWRTALFAQVALLTLEGCVLYGCLSYFSRPHPEDRLGLAEMTCAAASMIAFALALCSLTAWLLLLRPRTRLAYGVRLGK